VLALVLAGNPWELGVELYRLVEPTNIICADLLPVGVSPSKPAGFCTLVEARATWWMDTSLQFLKEFVFLAITLPYYGRRALLINPTQYIHLATAAAKQFFDAPSTSHITTKNVFHILHKTQWAPCLLKYRLSPSQVSVSKTLPADSTSRIRHEQCLPMLGKHPSFRLLSHHPLTDIIHSAMHEHTKRQFDMAITSVRRRSQDDSSPSLSSNNSSMSSVSSGSS